MDCPNGFIGSKTPPTPKQLSTKLGPATTVWTQLIEWLSAKGIVCKEWHSVSPKYGWALRPKVKTRTILYVAPGEGRFSVSFVLGDRALAAARLSDLPNTILEEIASARRYGEGTGLRLLVKTSADLAPIRKLVEIKLAN